MIHGTFKFGQSYFQVVIDKNNLMFFDVASGQITGLAGIRIDKNGVIKEFPDLKDDEDWKKKAIDRLKAHMKKFNTEKEKIDYIKDELIKFGNEAVYYQVAGFRQKKWN